MSAPVTILGTGHAGVTLARELRKLAPTLPLRLITRDDGHYYYKPDLSKALAAGKDAEGLIKTTAEQLAAQLGAEVLARRTVRGIDAAAHTIDVDGETLSWSRLVIATGAEVIRLPIPGSAGEDVLSVNDREDYARFRSLLQPGARVLIIGAGLIGCEFAHDLAAHGERVDVVDIAAWPLARLLPEAQGRALQAGLASLGVQWHLGTGVVALERNDRGIEAQLANGTILQVDAVLSAVGLRPRTALAAAAGLAVKTGIVVDDYLRSSAEDIYAIGDCIEINGRVLPYILPIAHATRALAQTLTGTPVKAKFPAMPVIVKTPVCPTLVNPPPPVPGAWEVSGSAPDLEALYRDDAGRPIGFALTGAAVAKRAAYTQQMPPVHEPA